MTKSVCGGVRNSTLDSLGMRYHKKRKNVNFHEKSSFFLKKNPMTFFKKKWKFSISHFFRKSFFSRNLTSSKKLTFWKFSFFWKMSSDLFSRKNFFSWKFSCFLFLWYLIPKLSNVELLTPTHTLLVTVCMSGIFSKIRKIPKNPVLRTNRNGICLIFDH